MESVTNIFQGLKAVVTGAGSGIGLEIATQLKLQGAEVIGLDIEQGQLADVGTFVRCDISD
jgi:NAD(P)-dependent dehydrogenase (short-subunit alcohol dehydrogenase family)